MNKTTFIHLTALALALAEAAAGHSAVGPQVDVSTVYAAGELLVKWKDGPESAAAAAGNASVGAVVERNFSNIGWQQVRLPPAMSLSAGLGAYRKLEAVVSVEPNAAAQPITPLSELSIPDTPNLVDSAWPLESPAGSGIAAYTNSFGFTSGAAPHVTGAAALLWAAKPDATLEQVTAALLGSVDHAVGLRGKLRTGGRLNVARALQSLTNQVQPPLVLYALPHNYRALPMEPLRVAFSQPMDRASVEAGFQVTPAARGQFSWKADSRTLTFTPSTSWEPTNHAVRILGTALDLGGRSLDGNYDLASQGSPADDFAWTFRPPLPNDDFAGAQSITGESGQVKASNRGTTLEADEPFFRWSGMVTLWYRWQPPRSGPFTFDLAGSSFDTMLDVFVVEGPIDPTLSPAFERIKNVAHNNDYGARQASRVSFSADLATNYWVRVNGTYYADDWESSMGNFTLSWSPTPVPRLTSFSPPAGPPGTKVTLVGTDFTLATTVEFNGVGAPFAAATNNPDQRLVATGPAGAFTGPIRITTLAGMVVSPLVFVVPEPTLRLRRVTKDIIELSWPTGWELQFSPDLGPGFAWANLLAPGAAPEVSPTGDRVVTVPTESGQGYFRLNKRP